MMLPEPCYTETHGKGECKNWQGQLMARSDDDYISEVHVNETGSLDMPLHIAPGTVIDERYEVVSLLGKGSVSTVYKVRHLLMDRPVAIKIMHDQFAKDIGVVERFKREAMAVSRLDHPNILKVYGCGSFGKAPYMAMEYLDGVNLSVLLEQKKRLSREEALPLFLQLLDALVFAHEKGIIHRDLKPGNVMLVGPTKQVKLLDFGIAKFLPDSGKELQQLTRTGDLFGSVHYMSPEQYSGRPVDVRSDLYSLGCLMYEVLDGEPPFKDDTPYLTMKKCLYGLPGESKFLAGAFGSVVLGALARDPARRPQSARELKDALVNPSTAARGQVPCGGVLKVRIAGAIIVFAGILLLLAGVTFLKEAKEADMLRLMSKSAGRTRSFYKEGLSFSYPVTWTFNERDPGDTGDLGFLEIPGARVQALVLPQRWTFKSLPELTETIKACNIGNKWKFLKEADVAIKPDLHSRELLFESLQTDNNVHLTGNELSTFLVERAGEHQILMDRKYVIVGSAGNFYSLNLRCSHAEFHRFDAEFSNVLKTIELGTRPGRSLGWR
jgi:serine/threonine protein kinase